MGTLDMTDVFMSEEFCDDAGFYVIQRFETINAKGRGVVNEVRTGPHFGTCVYGKMPTSRAEDHQSTWAPLIIITQFQLNGASAGRQPDQVEYNGRLHTLIEVKPYDRFGQGFCRAILVVQQANTPPTQQPGEDDGD